jgi:hypothetical protein
MACQFVLPAKKVGDYLRKQVFEKAITVDFGHMKTLAYHDILHLSTANKRYSKAAQLLNSFSTLLMQFSSSQ